MSNPGDTPRVDVRPLNARSLALSALLGTHPPELPARGLVNLAGLFGIAGGTMRTALSRMATNGEATLSDGRYRLAGRLLERQHAQDAGRRSPAADWAGHWHTVVVTADQRTVGERRRFRSTMANHRVGELRPDLWMRPANLPLPTGEGWLAVTGDLDGIDADDLARRLWDLDAISAEAARLLTEVELVLATTDWTDECAIPPAFTTSAAVVRFLRTEPLLPPELTPPGWAVDALRSAYDRVEADLQGLLRAFLRAA